MRKRLIFASMATAVFLISLLCGVLGGYAVLAVLLIAGIIVWLTCQGNLDEQEARARRWSPRLGFFMRTNNRWLLCMSAMTVISFILTVGTKAGAPVIKTAAQREVEKGGGTKRLEKIRQRYDNLYRSGEYKTDVEIGKKKPATPKPDSWTPWQMRWISFGVLLIMTIGYLPFALSDEFRAAFHRAERHFAEQGGGEAHVGDSLLRRFIQRVLGIAETVARPAPPAGVAGATTTGGTPPPPETAAAAARAAITGGWWKVFLTALLAEVLGERFFERRRV